MCAQRSHNRLDGMHNACAQVLAVGPSRPDANRLLTWSGGSERIRAKFMQGGMWEDPLGVRADGNAAMSNFWSGPPSLPLAFERTSKPVARSDYHPSSLSLLFCPQQHVSEHAHALAMPPPCQPARPPCPRPMRGNILMAISVMQQPTLPAAPPRVRAPVFLSFARNDSHAIPSVSFVCRAL